MTRLFITKCTEKERNCLSACLSFALVRISSFFRCNRFGPPWAAFDSISHHNFSLITVDTSPKHVNTMSQTSEYYKKICNLFVAYLFIFPLFGICVNIIKILVDKISCISTFDMNASFRRFSQKVIYLWFFFTVIMALLVPDLDPFISLVGAIFFSILGISIPAVVETISCWESHLGAFKWRLWKNTFLLIFSLLALVFGSLISVQDIIRLYQK